MRVKPCYNTPYRLLASIQSFIYERRKSLTKAHKNQIICISITIMLKFI